MLAALLRRKLGAEFRRNPFEIEDLLTSVVLGSCQYVPLDAAILPFLGAARIQPDEQFALRDRLGAVTSVEYEFWPSWFGSENEPGCEPELVLRFTRDGRPSAWVVVEAKLLSGKSSSATDEGPVTDQLAKYWLRLVDRARSTDQDGGASKGSGGDRERAEPIGIVYLTSGLSAPVDELDKSQNELCRKGHSVAPLFWLSWRSFLKSVQESGGLQYGIMRDVCELVRHRWKFVEVKMTRWPSRPARRGMPWRFDSNWNWPEWRGRPGTFRFQSGGSWHSANG